MATAIGLEGAIDHTGLAGNIAYFLASMGGTNPFIALTAVFALLTYFTWHHEPQTTDHKPRTQND